MNLKISEPLPPITEEQILENAVQLNQANTNHSNDIDEVVESEGAYNPFPVHCLPSVMGQMVTETARATTAQSLELAAVSALATCSAALGAGIQISTGGERSVRPNIYALAIAESGTGKGENFSITCAPLEECESEMALEFDMNVRPELEAKLRVTSERLKKQTNAAAKEQNEAEREIETHECGRLQEEVTELQRQLSANPKIRVSDATKEALAIMIQGQPGEALSSLSSEARGILSIVGGKYSKEGGDEDLYCSAYSGDSITVDRVGRPSVRLKRPCLTIFWMIQPDAAEAALSKESFTVSGLFPRFLILDPHAEPKVREAPPEPIPREIKRAWAKLIRHFITNIRERGDEPIHVEVRKDAKKILHEYENENIRRRCRNGDLRDLAPYAARWAENAWRIALILHCAKHPQEAGSKPLDAFTAANAVEVMTWFAQQQLAVLGASRHAKLRSRLLAFLAILAEVGGEITIRDLRRNHGIEKEELDQLYSYYPDKFYFDVDRPERGRPSPKVVMGQPTKTP